MGEYNSSDNSWKKMVLAKDNNQWTSTIKSEPNSSEGECTSTSSNITDNQTIKQEYHSVEQQGYNKCQEAIVGMIQELDPLLISRPNVRQRRKKGSVPEGESAEERAVRLAKMSAYAAHRLANESPEQRATRLKRMSEYAAKRLSQETGEQRAKRLARMSAYAARRLAKESPEQRSARLARMSAYAAKRHALKRVCDTSSNDGSMCEPDHS